MSITGADAVMIARGGVGNPTLISNINNHFENKDLLTTSLDDQIKYCLELGRLFIAEKGEQVAMRLYRGIASKFFEGYPNCKKLRCRLSTELNSYSDLLSILEEYKKEFSI